MNIEMKEIIVLFDEFGTPTFNQKGESDIFAGIAVLYNLEEESDIFSNLKDVLSLESSKPHKSRTINNIKAVKIAKIASSNLNQIVFNYIELNNKLYIDTIENYEKVISFGRKIYRGVKPRKVSQIMHSRLLDNCIHKCIMNHLDGKSNTAYQYKIYLDNWAIPNCDKHIELEQRVESLEKYTQHLLDGSNKNVKIIIPAINLLVKDNNRKRLIDGMMSIISRAFFNTNHPRFTKLPLNKLQSILGKKIKISNITNDEIEFINELIVEFTTSNPENY